MKKFSTAECNYDIHDKELVPIVLPFEEESYILRSCIDIITVDPDHQNQTYFDIKPVLKPHQTGWALNVAEFSFCVVYQPGKLDSEVHVVSRGWDLALGEQVEGLCNLKRECFNKVNCQLALFGPV